MVSDLQKNYNDSIEFPPTPHPVKYLILVGCICHNEWTKSNTLLLIKVNNFFSFPKFYLMPFFCSRIQSKIPHYT